MASTPYASGSFLLVLVLTWVNTSDAVTEARLRLVGSTAKRRQQMHFEGDDRTDHFRPEIPRSSIDGPCSRAECPQIERQVNLTRVNAVARQYRMEEWVSYESEVAKFSDASSDQFRDSFLKIIKYRTEANFQEEPIPITTPLVVSLRVNTKQVPRGRLSHARPKGFKYGYTMHYRLHSSVQGDPYREPTDQQILLSPWSPTVKPTDWVAVVQWDADAPDASRPDNVFLRYMELTGRINKELQKHNTVLSNTRSVFYTLYGSPVDRVHEIWVPLSETEVELLR